MQRIWYGESRWYLLLLPLSWLYIVASALRVAFYRAGILRTWRVGVPVVVVGNITVGGTGKTPIAIWLARILAAHGHTPAIVSRGYGGSVGSSPEAVTTDSDPRIVGDEAVLMAIHSSALVVVHPDRVLAANMAVELGASVVIADDGLQHYRLARDFELVLVDGSRGFGNGHRLPAGPLRESESRLESVDEILLQTTVGEQAARFGRRADDLDTCNFALRPGHLKSLDNIRQMAVADLAGQRAHAVAAIGNPGRFFALLRAQGIEVIEHPLRDHAMIADSDVIFDDDLPVVMTEKDAVKCRQLARDGLWYVPVEVEFSDSSNMNWVDRLLREVGTADEEDIEG